jgi:hypothetical protein
MIYDESIVKKIHILIIELINENKVSISMLEKANERITKLRNRVGLK